MEQFTHDEQKDIFIRYINVYDFENHLEIVLLATYLEIIPIVNCLLLILVRW